MISEYHIRYGGYGGIAYHHVADSYVAMFSHFIPCGTWAEKVSRANLDATQLAKW